MERNLHVVELKFVINMIEIIVKLLFMQIPKSLYQRLSNPDPNVVMFLDGVMDTVGGDIDGEPTPIRFQPAGR